MDVCLKGLTAEQALWLVNLIGRGAYEATKDGQALQALQPGTVLGRVQIEMADFGENLKNSIEEQRSAQPGANPDRIIVDLAPAPENVFRLKIA